MLRVDDLDETLGVFEFNESQIQDESATDEAPPPVSLDLQQIERMASQGMTATQIALALRMWPDDFMAIVERSPRLRESLLYGIAHGVDLVSKALQDRALDGEVAAQRFFLERKGGWTPPSLHVHNTHANAPAVPAPDIGHIADLVSRHVALLDGPDPDVELG